MKASSFLIIVAAFVALVVVAVQPADAATITVSNTNDGAAGSLRQAIVDSVDGGTINFSITGAITLTTGELLVDKSITISGPGANNLAVDGNQASRVFRVPPGKMVTISGLTIRHGQTTGIGNPLGDFGAGIYSDHATLMVANCTLSDNFCNGGGGGIYNSRGTLMVTNSTLSGNIAGDGGGIDNIGAPLTLTNSTLSGNFGVDGGGILNDGLNFTATATVTNCTFSGNFCNNHGGGILNHGGSGGTTVTIGNTILNRGPQGENIYSDVSSAIISIISNGYNLSSEAPTFTNHYLNATGDQTNTNPKLGPLANNGGPTLTFGLQPGSPALDAGNNTLASNAGLTTDGRGTGFSRVRDAASDADTTQTVDIGAFEADPSFEDISDKSTPQNTPSNFTFRVGDSATPFDSITATSSNTTLVSNGNIVVGNDTPSTRKLSITPAASQSGTATITVTVTKTINGAAVSMSDTFVLTVTASPSPTPSSTPKSTPTPTSTATPKSTPTPTPTPTSTPTSTPAVTPKSTPTPTATPAATPSATAAQSLNISTRLNVDTGDKLMIAGFIITGSATKPVLLRGMGPSLAAFGINNVLLDPVLELRDSNSSLMTDDNWVDSPQRSQFEGTAFQPSNDRESVVLGNLAAGNYTALLTGKNNTGGVGIIEAYDRDQTVDAKLANISTRGFVDTGANVMIGGFILGGGTNNTRVAVRGIGPSLAQFGLNPVLQDPTLELRDANGVLLIANDDWLSDPLSASMLTANGLGLADPKEAGIFTTLPPGQFTAILAGKNGGIGIALVEIYNLQ